MRFVASINDLSIRIKDLAGSDIGSFLHRYFIRLPVRSGQGDV